MRPTTAERRYSAPAVAAVFAVVASLALLSEAVVTGTHTRTATAAVAIVTACTMLVVAHRFLLSWSSLLGLTLCTILFIPMKRYAFPASLPFHLEPYRFVVGCILVAWLGSLLIDQRLALRRSGFEAPIFALFGAILISIVANIRRVDAVGTDFVKTLTFFLSYFLIFWLIVNVVRRPRDIDSLVRLLVYGGGALGFFALVEQATNFNIFNHISSVFPLLKYQPGLDPELAQAGDCVFTPPRNIRLRSVQRLRYCFRWQRIVHSYPGSDAGGLRGQS